MTSNQAAVIVKTYDAYVSQFGRDWADKHCLGAGTCREARNRELLAEARRVLVNNVIDNAENHWA